MNSLKSREFAKIPKTLVIFFTNSLNVFSGICEAKFLCIGQLLFILLKIMYKLMGFYNKPF